MHRHRARVQRGGVAPDAVHQLVAREHVAGVRGEEEEEVELLRREPERAAVELDLARAGVEREVVEREPLHGDRRESRAAQDGADARRELARRERLGDVVVGAELEADDAVGLLAAGGEHDHRQVALRPDPAAEREPVRSRQHHVEHDQVRRGALDQRAGGLAVPGLERVVALTLQVASDDVADDRLVVDDQHRRHRAHSSGSVSTHLRWWRQAQSSRTEPSVIPRSEWRVAG